MSTRRPGDYARHVTPPNLFTFFDAAERLGVSQRQVFNLVRRYAIPTGLLRRTVRLPSGAIVTRRVRTLTPTALQTLILHHAGYPAGRHREGGKP